MPPTPNLIALCLPGPQQHFLKGIFHGKLTLQNTNRCLGHSFGVTGVWNTKMASLSLNCSCAWWLSQGHKGLADTSAMWNSFGNSGAERCQPGGQSGQLYIPEGEH